MSEAAAPLWARDLVQTTEESVRHSARLDTLAAQVGEVKGALVKIDERLLAHEKVLADLATAVKDLSSAVKDLRDAAAAQARVEQARLEYDKGSPERIERMGAVGINVMKAFIGFAAIIGSGALAAWKLLKGAP